jgi:preprotein translocase subunit YajC
MPEFAFLAVMMLLGLWLYWSFVTFPKQRAFQKRQEFAGSLAKGDEVVTSGGIIGKVIEIDGELGIAQVEIAEGVVIRMLNVSLMQAYDVGEIARNAQLVLRGDGGQHEQ